MFAFKLVQYVIYRLLSATGMNSMTSQ